MIAVAITMFTEVNAYISMVNGIHAFNIGDCRTANNRFQVVLNSRVYDLLGLVPQAQQLTNECYGFLKAVANEEQGYNGHALAAYIDFQRTFPASGLTSVVPVKIQAIFGRSSMEELAVKETCDRVAILGESQLIPRSQEYLPVLYFHCGEIYESAGEFQNALMMYYQIRENYPQHALAGQIQTAIARLEIKIARQSGAGTIAQPTASGKAPVGTSLYKIRNDSPDRLQLFLNGTQTLIEEIPACESCRTYTQDPVQCPDIGPMHSFTLRPGKYDVLVKSVSSAKDTPFQGTWILESGQAYSECYFIVTTPER
jgi:tetratricopeptide (TPR) repeat protein